MTGSLQVKNGKFYIVLNIYENGKRKPKWISTGLPEKGNKRKAEQFLREALAEYDRTLTGAPCDILFADYIRLWLKLAQSRVDAVTFQGYELMANAQVLPYFDNLGIALNKVTREVLQAFFDEKATCGRMDGKGGLSPSSLRQYKNILNQTLKEAVKHQLIPSNPCELVELPRKEKYHSSYYNAAQLKELFDAIRNDPLEYLVQITALYGLRRSEVLGIQWNSIDFETGRLTIQHTVTKVTKAVAKDKTKNASSYRSFSLNDESRHIFLTLREIEKRNRRLFGKEYQQNDYVFKWPDGRPYSPDYVTDHFALLLKKNDLPHIRFHELRHSCASFLINQGFSLKDVQEYLGHADIQMTANIYGHLETARKETLTNTLCGMLLA